MFNQKTHRLIFLFGTCALAFGMMVGNSPTSIAQVILLVNWLLEADFKRKWQQLKSNELFWILISVYVIHAIGLFYTRNLNEGLNDVRTKIPLLLTPLVFFTNKPLSAKEFCWMLYAFLLGCFANTVWCLTYSFVLHPNQEIRNVSRFMSHIRLGLFINLAISCCAYIIYVSSTTLRKVFFATLFLYFLSVLIILGLASGIVYFGILCLFGFFLIAFKQKLIVKISSLLVIGVIVAAGLNYVLEIKNKQLQLNDSINNIPQKESLAGKAYVHPDSKGQKENGNLVLINIQTGEIERGWNRRCASDSISFRPERNLNRYEVLVRYLASKGLNKDSVGIAQLNETDILNIKNNITNYLYPQWSFLHKRIYELVNEYDEYKNGRHVNGHSITMRFYFWKTALRVIKTNAVFGVGTGDVQVELNTLYSKEKTLSLEWYKRPHNQFLTIAVSLGGIGLLIFIFAIFYPVIYLRKQLSVLYWPFFIITLLSFFTEDTLETMAGISFFGIWNTVFMTQAWFKKQQNLVD